MEWSAPVTTPPQTEVYCSGSDVYFLTNYAHMQEIAEGTGDELDGPNRRVWADGSSFDRLVELQGHTEPVSVLFGDVSGIPGVS